MTSTDDVDTGVGLLDDFGELLQRSRKRTGLSQSALAAKVGVHSSYVSRIERGKREPPTRDIILRIIEALQIERRDANQLLLSAGFAPLPNPDIDRVNPTLNLIADLFYDDRVSDTELSLLREYAELLDRLRQQR
jgi:transcriptional regulator with XRE-family HTH domain